MPNCPPGALDSHNAHLRDCISVLFMFIRKPVVDVRFSEDCRHWLDILVGGICYEILYSAVLIITHVPLWINIFVCCSSSVNQFTLSFVCSTKLKLCTHALSLSLSLSPPPSLPPSIPPSLPLSLYSWVLCYEWLPWLITSLSSTIFFVVHLELASGVLITFTSSLPYKPGRCSQLSTRTEVCVCVCVLNILSFTYM